MKILRKSSFVATPWKNGGGITHEAIRVPTHGDSFRWRISVAEIAVSGPFSDFSGYTRAMVLLRGAGVRLKFSDGRQKILREIGDLVEFDGALATQCELLAGGCADLNLIVAKSMQLARVHIEQLLTVLSIPTSHHESTIIFCVDGALSLVSVGGKSEVLGPWDLAVISDTGATRLAPLSHSTATMVFLATLRAQS